MNCFNDGERGEEGGGGGGGRAMPNKEEFICIFIIFVRGLQNITTIEVGNFNS